MAKPQPKPAAPQKPQAKQKPVAQGPGFLQFLIAREQWIDWALIGGLFVAILIFLKLYYPYPQCETDSGNYILSAVTGKINGYRPYGYSGFMRSFADLSNDIHFVVTWQWFMTFISVTWFLFSVKFIFRGLPRAAFYILCVIAILNPSVIYMDAYLMSDSLFVSLSLLFVTSVMWLIYNGSYVAMALNIILLWWCMDTRYIGLFYPLFSAVALGWTLWKKFRWVAAVGAAIPIIMLLFYRSAATDKMKEEFGVETFSAFGGWQKANNGVAVLPYVKVDETQITDPEVKAIHDIVKQYPDSFFKTSDIIATSFMWTPNYPGKMCLRQYIQKTGTPYMQAWAYMATQMEKYGDFLQSHYRVEYFKYYIIPNFKCAFKVYDINEYKQFKSDANMKGLFAIDRDVYDYKKEFFRPLTGIRQICDTLLWIVLALSAIAGLVMLRKINWTIEQKLIVGGLVLFVGAFTGASTVAAPINNFRYMMPLIYAQLTVPALVISAIIAALRKPQPTAQAPAQS